MTDTDHPANTPASGGDERPWQPWERNYSGNRIGVRTDGDWTILHVLSGGAETTTSIREHEAWDLAGRVSPKLLATLREVGAENRRMRNALHELSTVCAAGNAEALREAAEEIYCGDDCENHSYDASCNSHDCHLADRDGGCRWHRSESLKSLADALETHAALAAQPPKADGGVVPAGVDPHVLSAARQLSEIQRSQPEWLWFTDDKTDGIPVARYSFGRWAKVEGQAPYIRADLALAAAPPLNTGPEVGGGYLNSDNRKEVMHNGGDLEAPGQANGQGNAQDPRTQHHVTSPGSECDASRGAPAEAGEDLAGLSARATPGLAIAEMDSFKLRVGPPGSTCGNDLTTVALCSTCDRAHANLVFLAELWNAYRSGRLTPAASRPVEYPRDKMAAVLSACEVEQDIDLGRDGAQQAHYDAIDAIIGVLPALQPAPAASRPAVGREEIARLIADELGFFYDPAGVEEAETDDPKPEDYLRAADAILALLDPRDDTRAGGGQAQEGGR